LGQAADPQSPGFGQVSQVPGVGQLAQPAVAAQAAACSVAHAPAPVHAAAEAAAPFAAVGTPSMAPAIPKLPSTKPMTVAASAIAKTRFVLTVTSRDGCGAQFIRRLTKFVFSVETRLCGKPA
jgi:hypothetical protein